MLYYASHSGDEVEAGMEIGLIGLGKMGGNMAERIRQAGHTVVGFDRTPDWPRRRLAQGARRPLAAPRVVWVMVPAGEPTHQTIHELGEVLSEGDVVIDGGNSRYTDDAKHAEQLGDQGHRLRRRRRLRRRLGPEERLRADGRRRRRRTSRRRSRSSTRSSPRASSASCTPARVGAGHFAKMVHNGIEYGMMQAYAEGWELLEAAAAGRPTCTEVFRSWREGTVIRSWLLDLLVRALDEDEHLHEAPRLRRRLRRGPLDRRGRHRQRRADAGDHRLAVRPVRLAPGRLAGDEDGRGAA